MRILSVFVLYNPDNTLLTKNVSVVAPFVDHILLWQNSDVDQSSLSNLPFSGKIEWVGSTENKGISTALNYAWKYAVEHSYDFLLTMDQDSLFVGLDNYLANISESKDPVGIYGPGVNWMAFKGALRRFDFPITSGMLVPISILNTLGGYRPDFFVDGIDLDLTLRAKENGIPVYLVGNCVLLQQYGVTKSRKVLFKTISINSHSPERLYEMYRNFQILLEEHTYPEWKQHYKRMWGWKSIVKRILAEDDRVRVCRAIIKGIRDGKKTRLPDSRS